MANRRAVTGKAITGQAVTGTETDEEMPDYNSDEFEWEGACWALVSDPDLDIALVLPGGDEGLQEEFAARLANILRLNVENLYVTDTAVINEAVINRLFADMFTANKIGADQIAANSIDVSKLRVTDEMAAAIGNFLEINAEQVNSGSFAGQTFTGGEFQGAVIIGSSIATTRHPSNDGGVHIGSSTGIRAWNSSGQQTVGINGSSNFLSGTISTGREGQPAAILTPVSGAGGKVGGGVWFSTNGGLGNDQAAVYSYLDGNIHIRPKDTVPKGTVFIDGNLMVGDKTSFSSSVTANGITSSGTVVTKKPGRSTSSTANARIESSGVIRMTASSLRYKQEIEDWSPSAEDVLKLQPRSWKEKPGLRPDMPDYQDPNRYVGFIAEEVVEAGLEELVVFEEDEDGNYGPDNLNYDRIPAAHQVVLRDHEARILELEERLAALENGDD